MNKKYIKWFKGALLCTAVMAGAAACTDDHFDIDPSVAGRQTLWENISGNEELSEFADLLSRVKFSKSEGITTDETYAAMLNSEQTFTVWAPQNGTYDYEMYDSLLNTEVAEDAYRVEKELIRNCMTRFSHVMTGGKSIRMEMFNGKTALFDAANATIKGQTIVKPNVGASNGILHIIDGAVEYQPNLYEFMATRDDLDSLNSFISSFQEVKFNEELSTQGPVVNGVITWVDSVYSESNNYLSGYMRAFLTREDSSYAVVMPNNAAWAEALAKTKSYYNYKMTYKQDVTTVTPEGKDTVISGVETIFEQAELDSISNHYAKNAIAQNLAFNANAQWGWGFDDFAVYGRCDSLKTTAGVTFLGNVASLFDGADPIETSNGYAYIVNSFNYPVTTWASEMIIEAEYMRNLESIDSRTIGSSTTYTLAAKDFVPGLKSDTTVRYGCYLVSPKSTSANPCATFILRDLLSCKYDIYLLVAYNDKYAKQNKFTVTLAYDTEEKRVNNESLKNPDVTNSEFYDTKYFTNRMPSVSADSTEVYNFVDSVLVAQDFNFPVCYEGLENAYVTMEVKSNVTSRETKDYTREMRIDKIILKAKE